VTDEKSRHVIIADKQLSIDDYANLRVSHRKVWK